MTTYTDEERKAAMALIYANEDNRSIRTFDDALNAVRSRGSMRDKLAVKAVRQHDPIPGETESDFQRKVEKLARDHGWMLYHTFNSERSEPGYPDLHFVHTERGESFFVELKTANGRASQPQVKWLLALQKVGHTVYLWSPNDWDEIERVLRGADE
jgi:hypothetical protein